MTAEEVVQQVEKDRLFYDQSGGGVTLSGGEPLMQPTFSCRLLQACHERGIHTAVETCGCAPWEAWQPLLPHLDLVLYDLKETNPVRHRQYTGVPNDLILDNLKSLATTGKRIIVRRPVIPGFNDDLASMRALGQLVQGLGTIDEIHLLPYHRLGQTKYERLGIEYVMGDRPSLMDEEIAELQSVLSTYGLRVRIGG
jgi:pyruvate formate lyase activating enzyme